MVRPGSKWGADICPGAAALRLGANCGVDMRDEVMGFQRGAAAERMAGCERYCMFGCGRVSMRDGIMPF